MPTFYIEKYFLSTGLLQIFTGFLVIGDQLKSLPIGSTPDTKNGIFTWQPGPGFYGTYEVVFTMEDGPTGVKSR
jgi:hypothetical protein